MTDTKPFSLTATQLKYLACLLMVGDHVAAIFVADPFWYTLLRSLGRLSMPIFLFFVAEGCARTRDLKGYAKRMYLFALVAQLPFMLAFQMVAGSVIFTFFLGVGAVCLYEEAQEYVPAPLAVVAAALPMALLAELTYSDYGAFAVLMVLALYLARGSKQGQFVLLLLGCTLLQHSLFSYMSIFALPLLWLYRGERGTGHKWFFYWFYPAHLLCLAGLAILFLR